MKNVGRVQGNESQAQSVIVGKTLVRVHSNIVPIEKDPEGRDIEGLYEYDEIQYTKDEWIEMLTKQGEEASETLDDILTNVLPTLIEGGIE